MKRLLLGACFFRAAALAAKPFGWRAVHAQDTIKIGII